MVFGLNSLSEEITLEGGFKTKILFQKDTFLFASKPVGLPVHETKDTNRPDFTRLLSNYLEIPVLRCVNRLDLGTSGIVLFGKQNSNNETLDLLLKNAQKSYIFLAKGNPKWKETRFECFLKDGNKKVQIVRSGGKKAITDFFVLEKYNSFFKGKAVLVTGRRHQIRVSLSDLGTPIIGDSVYGEIPKKEKRMYLHAFEFSFEYEGETIQVIDQVPYEFQSRCQKESEQIF